MRNALRDNNTNQRSLFGLRQFRVSTEMSHCLWDRFSRSFSRGLISSVVLFVVVSYCPFVIPLLLLLLLLLFHFYVVL